MQRATDAWPDAPDLQNRTLAFDLNGHHFEGHLVAPAAEVGPRPLILVIHNYQGLKQFDRDVAEYLARLGYVGLAIDMYGDQVPMDQRELPTDPALIEPFQKRWSYCRIFRDLDIAPFLGDVVIRKQVATSKAKGVIAAENKHLVFV